jgi:thiol-disulfide isomerase/thioredoxin
MTRPWFALTLALTGIVGGCGGAPSIPASARTTVVSLDRVDSADRGLHLAKVLAHEDGGYKARFDRRRAELTVIAAPSLDVMASARRLSKNEAFNLVLGAGQGSYLAWPSPPAGGDIQVVVTQGGEVVPELLPVLAPGKVTIVDFSAVWCAPCKRLDEHMNAVAASQGDVAYRKLDVGDWDSPVAKRYLHAVPYLPYVIVFDRKGKESDHISGFDLEKLDAAIVHARGGS